MHAQADNKKPRQFYAANIFKNDYNLLSRDMIHQSHIYPKMTKTCMVSLVLCQQQNCKKRQLFFWHRVRSQICQGLDSLSFVIKLIQKYIYYRNTSFQSYCILYQNVFKGPLSFFFLNRKKKE